MALGDFTVNWWRRRFPKAHFSVPWMTNGYQILARQVTDDPYATALDFIRPFNHTLWATIIGILALISIMFTMIETATIREAVFRSLLRMQPPPEASVTEDSAVKSDEMSFSEGS
jgi:hypothetical protein